MTGSMRRRLLAAVLLIFVIQLLSRAQSTENRPIFGAANVVDSPALNFHEPYRPPTLPVTSPVGPLLPRRSALAQIATPAGIIFSGQVISVGRSGLPPQDSSSTTITFQVDEAIRGTVAGQTLTIHEWAGLWSHGERYRVGERVLLFLFPPSKLGLTSPVAGAWGRFEIDSAGRISLDPHAAEILGVGALEIEKNTIFGGEFMRIVRQAVTEE
jgi:hypothetical protein